MIWKLLDWVDNKILGHPFYWLCDFICEHYPNDELNDPEDDEYLVLFTLQDMEKRE